VTAPEYVPGHGLLAGKVVVVTAAAGTGIGYATAKKAQEEGATVVVSDWHERRLAETAEALGVLGVRCDVTVEEDVQHLLASTVAAHGRLDVLVNNAGLGGTADLVDMTDEQWSKVLDVTLTGTMRCTRAALRIMREQGSGVIVNNASVIGWRAQ
jgi:3-oxoacyl-[acyl-carrier protein] reductase